jgi:hypothetical protein
MSAAKKLSLVPTPATPTLEDVQAELAAAQQALSAASAAVDAAEAALDASLHDPAAKRSLLREEHTTAKERLESAQMAIAPLHARLHSAQRREDEKAFKELRDRVGNAAQLREAQTDAREFIEKVGGAVEAFFDRVAARNIKFLDETTALSALWARLGHEYRAPDVSLEPGTGTETIPPRVSLECLRGYEHHVRNALHQPNPNATPVQQATRQFLLGAISFARTAQELKLATQDNFLLRAQMKQSAAKETK